MELIINNFAKIESANITFDGITVVAGENNTGKSTIGKILFALFNSLGDIDNKIQSQRKSEVTDACMYILQENSMHFRRNYGSAWGFMNQCSRGIAKKFLRHTKKKKIIRKKFMT